jgi:hypothetical protein
MSSLLVATPIRCKASIVVTCQNETKTISNILYVLGVRKNLLPIGALTNMGCIVTFGKNKMLDHICTIPTPSLSFQFLRFCEWTMQL